MPKYKLDYLYTEKKKEKWFQGQESIDGATLAKQTEALLLECEKKDYELESITPIVTSFAEGMGDLITKTDGLLVVLKKNEENNDI